jgi:K+-transporting ATPase ATPase C chain
MIAHLRATLWLFASTLLVCCVLYPLALWAIGQGLFPKSADGSLVVDDNGKVRGSRLLAQPFSDAKYFQPRPSAVGYDAQGSGGSNLAASNPKLRGRVAQRLGLIARFAKDGPRKGEPVGPDIEKWFATQVKEKKRNPTLEWAEGNPALATEWVNSSDSLKSYITEWADAHPETIAEWRKANPGSTGEPKPVDLAGPFFVSFCKVHPGTFPGEVEVEKKKTIRPVTEGDEIRQVFFDTWLTENAGRIDPLHDLEQVPGDLVMTSGSGLDPHITLKGARYQLDVVVEARAKATGKPVEQVRDVINQLLKANSFRQFAGLIGEPLVNVLELNRAMDEQLTSKQ